MPVVTNYNILRTDLIELKGTDLATGVKIADFELPAEAITRPAVLTSMVYSGRDGSVLSGSQFFFTLLLNDHVMFRDVVFFPKRPVLLHGIAQTPSTSITVVIPVTSPPILIGGSNTLSMRSELSTEPDAGVGFSDVVLWWKRDI